jgi:hypothetical protein
MYLPVWEVQLFQNPGFSTTVREYRRGNEKWTIKKNWQHRVHKTKKNWQHRVHKTKKNWQHRVHKTKKNWQHRVHKTKKNKTKTIQRNWQHRVHKTKKNKNTTNTYDANKKRSLLRKTGGKDEPDIFFMRNS